MLRVFQIEIVKDGKTLWRTEMKFTFYFGANKHQQQIEVEAEKESQIESLQSAYRRTLNTYWNYYKLP